MLSTLTGLMLTSFLAVIGKLFTQSFFEAVMTKLIIFAAEKLSKMTTNTIDDELVIEIKKRLGASDETNK